MFSIDSLRDIVDKEPLARPNPFDPPSPPLSSFLPPPQGAVVQQSSSSSPQYYHGSQGNVVPQQQSYVQQQQLQSQQSFIQQQLQQPQQQVTYVQQQLPQQQQLLQPNTFIYTKPTPQLESNIRTEILPPSAVPPQIQQQTQQPQAQIPTAQAQVQRQSTAGHDGGDVSDDGEDEGLPYATENLDNEGKKLSYIYSRPVQLPDVTTTTKMVEYGDRVVATKNQPDYNQEMESLNRKPVSYENEEDGADGNRPDDKQPSGVFEEGREQGTLYSIKPLNDKPLESPPTTTTLQINQPLTTYESNFNSKPPQQLSQWENNFDQPKDSRPTNIEYGGFVPIKNSGISASDFLDKPTISGQNNPALYDFALQKNYFQDQPQQQQQRSQYSTQINSQNEPFSIYSINNNNQNYGQQPLVKPFNPTQFLSKLPNMRFKPLYGRDAMKKLRELGISEDEFYGTVNKILKNSHSGVQRLRVVGPNGPQLYNLPFIPKANLYRAPQKGGQRGGTIDGGASNKIRPLSNSIVDEFDFSK